MHHQAPKAGGIRFCICIVEVAGKGEPLVYIHVGLLQLLRIQTQFQFSPNRLGAS